jgi:hypothetical protein
MGGLLKTLVSFSFPYKFCLFLILTLSLGLKWFYVVVWWLIWQFDQIVLDLYSFLHIFLNYAHHTKPSNSMFLAWFPCLPPNLLHLYGHGCHFKSSISVLCYWLFMFLSCHHFPSLQKRLWVHLVFGYSPVVAEGWGWGSLFSDSRAHLTFPLLAGAIEPGYWNCPVSW